MEQLLGVLRKASRSLDVAAFALTEAKIADEIVDAAHRGVSVRVVVHCENGQAKKSGQAARMLRLG